MPCLVLLFALLSPRLAIIVVAIFSNLLTRAFDGSWVVPLIGFFILPWTTLAYALMWDNSSRGVHGFEWFIVIVAFLIDLGSLAGGAARRR
jgi:hypothetical protein